MNKSKIYFLELATWCFSSVIQPNDVSQRQRHGHGPHVFEHPHRGQAREGIVQDDLAEEARHGNRHADQRVCDPERRQHACVLRSQGCVGVVQGGTTEFMRIFTI